MLHVTWPPVALTLLDCQSLALPRTIADYAAVGWVATAQTGDVLDWAAADGAAPSTLGAKPHWDLIVANLFLHHLSDEPLAALLSAVAARTDHCFACEPRTLWPADALGWTLREYPAGLFSHCMTASRFPVSRVRSEALISPVSLVSPSRSA